MLGKDFQNPENLEKGVQNLKSLEESSQIWEKYIPLLGMYINFTNLNHAFHRRHHKG